MIYGKDKRDNIVFPLGGIGTGSVGINGAVELRDFEIFGKPARNTSFGYTFFALRSESERGVDVRILQGDTVESYMGNHSDSGWRGYGFGPACDGMSGFPHFEDVELDLSFPIYKARLSDIRATAKATLTAFNPFIPNDEDASSCPSAFFEWEIENTTDCETVYDVILSLQSPYATASVNKSFDEGGVRGIFFTDEGGPRHELGYTDITIATNSPIGSSTTNWYRGAWHDDVTSLWRALTERGGLEKREYDTPGKRDTGSLSARITLAPRESGRVRFVISWSTPMENYPYKRYEDAQGREIAWKNYYATVFETSRESAAYALAGFDSLYERTRVFCDAVWGSDVPDFVKDAAMSNLAVLKSTTCLRLEGGEFWAWEGVMEKVGSCEGTCQHVWNYAYAMPYIFPRLERSLRQTTMEKALFETGATEFRVHIPYGTEHTLFRPCVDGQMGEVIKCYREWKLSGDSEWLRKYKDKIFSMLEFAWSPENPDKWDLNMDGVLEGRQHHTLDMELFGPSSWLQGMYLLALGCAEEMARYLGEDERADKYGRIRESGVRYTNECLFKNGYFSQSIDIDDVSVPRSFGADNYVNEERGEIAYQIGDGCFIDQVLADFHAHLVGAECVFDKEKKTEALRSLLKHNRFESMRTHTNMWRVYALNDESGVVMCTYPDGVRKPEIPIPYCDEAMTGFEYALACLMINEGMQDEGESIVKAIRDRYDGKKRNPFSEIECGASYARSMASFALLPTYSGMTYDMTRGYLGFSPINGDGVYFFAIAGSFGTVDIGERTVTLKVLGDALTLSAFGTDKWDRVTRVSVDGAEVKFSKRDGETAFDTVTVKDTLTLTL